MGSVSHSVEAAAKRGEYNTQDDSEISKAAELLVAQHGEEAGSMAARQADVLFRQGNAGEGARWLAIFRKIAMTHP